MGGEGWDGIWEIVRWCLGGLGSWRMLDRGG
jgi:hypothetical protein